MALPITFSLSSVAFDELPESQIDLAASKPGTLDVEVIGDNQVLIGGVHVELDKLEQLVTTL